MKLLTSDRIFKQITEIVQSAQESLKIASAWIKGKYFEDILDLAKEKNIPVEIILRASEFQDLIITDDRVFRKIQETGGKVYLCNRLHAKFIIVDDEKAVVGSANFTEAGLSDLSKGNIEAGVFYDSSDGKREIEELVNYFESIKQNYSSEFGNDLLGFTLNPVKSHSFEFILIDEDVSEQSYVEIRLKEGKVLARVTSIYAYDMGFFANPFTSQESVVFAPIEDFKKIFSDDRDKEWKKSAVYAYISGNGNRMKIAIAEVVGFIKDRRLDMVKKPFDVGEAVYKVSQESLELLMKKTSSGRDMVIPVKVGTLGDSDIDVFVDGKEVVNKHMLIIGTTGSGKSYFTKLFLCRLVQASEDVQVFIFDPHGEYYDDLVDCLGGDSQIEHIVFEDTFFPLYADEVTWLIKDAGFSFLVSGNSNLAKENNSKISGIVKPSLKLTGLSSKSLLSIISCLSTGSSEVKIDEVLEYLKNAWGEDVLSNQPATIDGIEAGLKSDKRIVIFNFRHITDPQTRVNIAGLIMQELFNENKRTLKNRIVVLEEAHNFAPEKGYGDVSSGRDNLALNMAKKIASEGRKFNLGLITITQRPAQVSKYVLSQMNTQAMFRTINSSDIGTISTYVEYTGEDIIGMLPSLPTGTGIISGMGVPFPVVVEVG